MKEINEEKCLFNIDEFIRMYSGGNLRPYFQKRSNANDQQLDNFATEIKKHKKLEQKIKFATLIISQGKHQLLIHEDILLKAIKWEKIKRSKLRIRIHRTLKPFIRWWWGFWNGADLIDTEHLGPMKKHRERGKTLLEFLGLRKCLLNFLLAIWKYFIRNHKWIITTVVGVVLAICFKSS